jgi:tRNA A-37 threonylcarbamoyl transferase component Bud32/ABC-type phosphate/phosphonate transport system substrate-binding protein
MSEPEIHCTSGPARRCGKCGAELHSFGAAGTSYDQCPNCMLGLGFFAPNKEGANSRDFGEYKLVRQVGRGAMGVVYEALQANIGRTVALKMILNTNLHEPAVRRRFKIEAEAAAKLQHPNIVPVYDFGERDEQPYLTMQLIQGETLRDKIRRGDLSLSTKSVDAKEVARLMATVADAVAHAHEKNVLHRDLKPANILLDTAGQPHLTDFGLAKILEEPGVAQGPATLSGGVVGTPSYMAPECAKGGASSKAADIYSLGAILYEMLTGQPPFKAPSALETLRLAAKGGPTRPRILVKRVPRDLETICLKCLEANPASRYNSAAAVAEDLERWLQGKPILARPAGCFLRVARWGRRNPVGAVLILVLCGTLLLVLALLQSMRQQARWQDLVNQKYLEEYPTKVEKLWRDPETPAITIDSVYLAVVLGKRLIPPNSLPLTFGMEITGDPLQQADAIAPVLRCIEQRMENELHRPVDFSLFLQKHRPDVAAPTISRDVHFQRLGPLAYITAKATAPGLQLMAQELTAKEGVIFIRKELGITNLPEIKGLRVAFAHTNSIVSFEAKVQMAKAGITARDLLSYSHLDPPLMISGEVRPDLQFAHNVVIEAVLSNSFDVGEARLHQFVSRNHRAESLLELCRFPVAPRVYVANPAVPTNIARAFRNALLKLKSDKEIAALRRMLETESVGFKQVKDEDLNYIRFALTNEILRFEARD